MFKSMFVFHVSLALQLLERMLHPSIGIRCVGDKPLSGTVIGPTMRYIPIVGI
jgi:hypothetical protein